MFKSIDWSKVLLMAAHVAAAAGSIAIKAYGGPDVQVWGPFIAQIAGQVLPPPPGMTILKDAPGA